MLARERGGAPRPSQAVVLRYVERTLSMRTWTLYTMIAVGAVSTLHARVAQACSGGCWPAAVLPTSDATLPRNVPGFPFRTGHDMFDFDTNSEAVTLKDSEGNIVETRLDVVASTWDAFSFNRLLVPVTPLAEGVYTIEVEDCATQTTVARSVAIADASPFPAEVGTLRAVRSTEHSVTLAGGASCIDQVAADSVKLELDPAPAFAPFQPVTDFEVLVDGNPWRGPVASYIGFGFIHTLDPFTVYAICSPTQSSAGPVKHVVEVRAHILGAPSDPAPTSIEIELDCSRFAGDAAAEANDASVSASDPSADESGCSSTHARKGGASATVTMLVLTALLSRARRARQEAERARIRSREGGSATRP